MDLGFKVFLAVLSGLTFQTAHAQEEDFSPFEARGSSNFKAPLTPSESIGSRVSVVMPSFVIHGIQPYSDAVNYMPRKLDPTGTSVATPGVGLAYEGHNGLLLLGALVKDCYDGLAGTLQVGQVFSFGRTTKLGYSMGVYMRETPMSCTTSSTGSASMAATDPRRPGSSGLIPFTRTQTTCTTLDGFDWKFMTTINGESVDIIPLPFLHFSTALLKFREFELDVRVMSNFVLNEFGFSIPF
jgi:hypothetical protein